MDIKDDFIRAIREKKLATLIFNDKNGQVKTRKCVPLDYGPSSKAKYGNNRYHFWDLNSPDGPHNLSLLPVAVIKIDITTEIFDPADYVTWQPISWHISRDWGDFS